MDAQATIEGCEFCHGLKFEPPGALQFTVYGELHWLHPQCIRPFEKVYSKELNEMAIPDAPADGYLYARKDNAWVRVPSGFSTRFEFTFDNAVAAPPTDSQLRFNNADPVQVSKLFVNNKDADGVDVSNFLMLIQSGFTVYLQDKNDPTISQRFEATGPIVKQTGYCEIPVTKVSGSLASLIDNQRIVMMVYGGG